jgi:hypothetical protein
MTGIILQSICFSSGIALIAAGILLKWGLTAIMAGIFFINITIVTILIDLSKSPGWWQPILMSKTASIIMLLSVVALLIAVVIVGVLTNMGILR